MNDRVARFRKGTEVLDIYVEQSPNDPREWGGLGIMVLFHPRYTLPNETKLNKDDYNSWDEVEKAIKKQEKGIFITPVRIYDHSGISFSISGKYPYNCPWDSGVAGFIFTTRERLKEYGIKAKDAKAILSHFEDEINTYNQYLNGDVYGYVKYNEVKCAHGTHLIEQEDGSCWGFYGTNWEENGLVEAADIKSLKEWKEEPQ